MKALEKQSIASDWKKALLSLIISQADYVKILLKAN